MDERKNPMIPGATSGAGERPAGESLRYEHTEVRVRDDTARPEPGARIYESRGADDRRDSGFESDSGRIRAGIDHTRRDIDQTIDALQDKLSPDRLMDRFVDYFRGTPGHGSKRVMELIRDNPVPAALVGAGIGWMVMEKAGVFERYARRPEVGRHRDSDWLAPGATYYPPGAEPPPPEPYGGVERRESGPGVISRAASAVGGAFGAVRDTAGSIAHGARSTYSAARGTISSTRERLSGAGTRVRDSASHLSDRARDAGARARESAAYYGHAARENAAVARERIAETYDDSPLAMAGLAVAGGLILGLLLPPTRREDRLLGDVRDDLMDRAKDTGRDLYESGQRVARAAAEAAREEAEAEDLTPNTVMQSAKRIVGRAAEAAKDEAQHEGERIKEKAGVGGSQALGGQSMGGSQSGQGPQRQGGQSPGQSGQNRTGGGPSQRGPQGGQGGPGRV